MLLFSAIFSRKLSRKARRCRLQRARSQELRRPTRIFHSRQVAGNTLVPAQPNLGCACSSRRVVVGNPRVSPYFTPTLTATDFSVQHFVHCHLSYFVLPEMSVPFLCISTLHFVHCIKSPLCRFIALAILDGVCCCFRIGARDWVVFRTYDCNEVHFGHWRKRRRDSYVQRLSGSEL